MAIPAHVPRWAKSLSAGSEVTTPGSLELRGGPLVAPEHPARPRPAANLTDSRHGRVRPGDEPVAEALVGRSAW